ncbi:hypothetical protein CP8484711_1557, partial [Chlamydia psittaci 84-8471/1]
FQANPSKYQRLLYLRKVRHNILNKQQLL